MKKICAMLLAILQILTISVCANAMQLTDTQKEDLYKLEIMTGDENGNLRLNDNITRAEAAKMICAAGNINLQLNIGENFFNDIPANHWAYRYVYAAKRYGIADGDDNGNFNPESSITNEETVKMIVCLLGYRELAERQSGYPAGYIAVASGIGITSGLNLKPKTPATRNDVAVMISNALDIPIMVQTSEGEDKNDDVVAYVALDGKNGIPFSSIRGTRGLTFDTSLKNINKIAQAFASRYPYKEGDTEKSFELYPDIVYSSGIEKSEKGVEYECPAIYDDNFAHESVSRLKIVPVKLQAGNSIYDIQSAVFNSKLLVPYDTFKLIGCETLFDKNDYVATITKNDTTVEIIPNLTGMRKNKAEGYWVPLEICARFIEDKLYVPLDAVSKEFGYTAETDAKGNIRVF